ncbi:acetyl-CoA carboxylase, carboxyltransferase subunit beta [Hathewaya proteolytica]|uniref:acetyl-CoA carboxylase, carboxyltransferase subunit beta n=1 Tax=Hathewaya proteolytica TaxID=29365 RepID=UPI001FA8E591|nr:acetyl-CoA carboxylase, carboxyltransferase subunit beta [Hathewaya proteolytica]
MENNADNILEIDKRTAEAVKEFKDPFKRRKAELVYQAKLLNKSKTIEKKEIEGALFENCPHCGKTFSEISLLDSMYVCPECDYHFKISANYRISLVLDEGTFREINEDIVGSNPLEFPDYDEKIRKLQEKTGLKEGVVTGVGKISGEAVVVAVLDSRFMMGSMGTAVGEKITLAIEYSTKHMLPIIIFCASGGARMQEGIFSLVQMSKTSAALEKHKKAGLLYISVLTNPTTGGVTASFGSLGDIIIAEPKALIGFAGPRVIEQTLKQKLPEGFQSAEYLKEHGFIDNIVPRNKIKHVLSLLLKLHERKM